MEKKELKSLNKIKFNAWKLKTGGQIPPVLFTFICELDETSKVEDVKYLSQLTEHYLRIKGYYIKYKEISQQCDVEIFKMMKERSK